MRRWLRRGRARRWDSGISCKVKLSDKGGESRAGAVFEVEIYDGLFACEIGEVTGVDYEFRTVIQFEEWCSRSKRRYVEHDGFDVVAVDSDYGHGTAPLQPLEVADAANRIAFLCLTEFSSKQRNGTI